MESIKKYNIYGVNGKYESDYGRNIDHKNISPEQALKDLREDAKRHFFEQRQHLNKRLDIIENALKVLAIIKEKEVVFIFLHNGDLETYNDMVEDNRKLTQEEYDLLKRELTDGKEKD